MSRSASLTTALDSQSFLPITSSDDQLSQAKPTGHSSCHPAINLLSLILFHSSTPKAGHLSDPSCPLITMLNRLENREAARRWLELKQPAV